MTIRTIAVHDLGGTGPTTMYAHATGFHARCWEPVAARLPAMHNIAYDAKGHGDTPADPDGAVDWATYGADAAAVADSLNDAGSVNDEGSRNDADFLNDGGPVLGVGHSMGGAALLMAALSSPESFTGIVVYEPIVMPPAFASVNGDNNLLAARARRRRSTFASFEQAVANYSSKPPLNIFTPESMEAYVRGGFAVGDDRLVHLKCSPEHEARTFEAASDHDTWERLVDISVPVWLLCGRPQDGQPSAGAASLAERIPGARYIQLDHLGHFGPMQSPGEIAALIADAAANFSPT